MQARNAAYDAGPGGVLPALDPPRSDFDAHRLLDILERIECHVYTAEVTPDGDYRELFTGPAVEALLGGSPPEGMSDQDAWLNCIHPDDVEYERANGCNFEDEQPTSLEYRLIGYDGITRWMLDRMWPRPIGADGRRIFDGVVTDVTALHDALAESRLANERLIAAREDAELLARTDELTGLSNRRHFAALLRRHLARAAHESGPVALLLIDIDHFKQINDAHGHFAGDVLLTQFAQRLAAAMRPGDVVARWGGEEFVALLRDSCDENVLLARADQIRVQLASQPFEVGDQSVEIRASIGAVLSGGTVRTAADLLSAADQAMYAAKRGGRNRVSLAQTQVGVDRS